MSCQFYLVGEDVAASRLLDIDPKWSFEDVQRAAGAAFHVAQPTGKPFISSGGLVTPCKANSVKEFRFTLLRTKPLHP